MGVSCCMAVYDISDAEIDDELVQADLVIDAVLGYRGRGAPHDEVATLVERIASAEHILSLDLPSGWTRTPGSLGTGHPRLDHAHAGATQAGFAQRRGSGQRRRPLCR